MLLVLKSMFSILAVFRCLGGRTSKQLDVLGVYYGHFILFRHLRSFKRTYRIGHTWANAREDRKQNKINQSINHGNSVLIISSFCRSLFSFFLSILSVLSIHYPSSSLAQSPVFFLESLLFFFDTPHLCVGLIESTC